MDFKTRIYDKTFQATLSALFENHGYNVIPTQFDTIARELNVYGSRFLKHLNAPASLRLSPSFLLLPPDKSTLQPVIAEFYDSIEDIGLDRYREIAYHHGSVYFVVFLSTPPESLYNNAGQPSFHIRVLKTEESNDGADFDRPVDQPNWWWSMRKIQEAFPMLDEGQQSIRISVDLLKKLGELL